MATRNGLWANTPRAIQAAQATAQVAREIRSADELRAALTPLDDSSEASVVANTGRRLLICASFMLTSTVVIPPTLIGVVIESNGHIPIFCGVDGVDAFSVQAGICTLRDLVIVGSFDGTKRFRRAVLIATATPDPNRIMLDSLTVVAGALCHDETVGDSGDLRIRDCNHVEAGAGALDAIVVNSARFRITGCALNQSGGGIAIRAGAQAGSGFIGGGTDCFAAGINTGASLGLNVISGVTNVGAIVNAGTDQVGLNT